MHPLHWWNGKKVENEKGYTTDLLTKYATDFIARHRAEPFFVYLAHEAPHTPLQGRDPIKKKSRQDTYKGMIEVLGESVGSILATLHKHRLEKNTLLIFCVVLIRKGLYRLDETVVFGLEDSGEGDSSVTYAAYPGEEPVFSSGRQITSWTKVTASLRGLPKEASGNVWVADVPHRVFTLYDAEGLLPRARWKE